ncbi:hypothetical protein BDN70DRAFT_880276 [Pholiota conissans]|uniref:Uncharacterized protein n=1 Tax=Pholiota conissans TaxID=109636 RepID=A0A9P5Z142_9AGAR|nr:hypothetical protein BDN70DRAFT_880276 [Pholiota conissans]
MSSKPTESKTTDSNTSTVSFESTTTVSSTSPLSSRAPPPQKDYAAALSALQSRYGTGGVLPSPKTGPSKKLPDSPLASASNSPVASLGGSTPNDSQATLANSTTGSEGSEGSGSASSSTSTGDQSRKKSKPKTSILKSLFKGKAKEKEDA